MRPRFWSVSICLQALFTPILFAQPLPQASAEITDAKLGVSLSAPSPWHVGNEQQYLLPSEEELTKAKLKKIHIVIPKGNPDSLERAMFQEMDSIDARDTATSSKPPRPPSSNGRHGLSGSHSVLTASGIEGLCAEFGSKNAGRLYYGINKYYFWHKDGRIFKVCAHVYGDQATADEFEKIILNELHYSSTTREPQLHFNQ